VIKILLPHAAIISLLVTAGAASEEANSSVICQVAGYDVILQNHGAETIEAGSELQWFVPFARVGNTLALDEPMEPGESRYLPGHMAGNYMSSDEICNVTVVPGSDSPAS
jgi:hypothetical protein